MDNGEGEFAFCQVFAEAFEGGVARGGGEVEVVVEDLEEEADGGYEGGAVTNELRISCLESGRMDGVWWSERRGWIERTRLHRFPLA